MRSWISAAATACVIATIAGCSEDEAPKTPLGAAARAPAAEGPITTITGEAKQALDNANSLFRAKAYDQALAQYRQAARLAPQEMAPLLGILMVADATKDARLKETTLREVRKLDPAATDSSVMGPHTMIPAGHPPLTSPPARQ